MDRSALTKALEAILRGCALPAANDHDLLHTADRVGRLWEVEFLAGYSMDPETILRHPIACESTLDVVVVSGLRFHSLCPEHLLPYRGLAHIAYLPVGRSVGFGRLADLVDCFTKRLTRQGHATRAIAEALCRGLGAHGAGCLMERQQDCLSRHHENQDWSSTITSAIVGESAERDRLMARLFAAAKQPRPRMAGPSQGQPSGHPT